MALLNYCYKCAERPQAIKIIIPTSDYAHKDYCAECHKRTIVSEYEVSEVKENDNFTGQDATEQMKL